MRRRKKWNAGELTPQIPAKVPTYLDRLQPLSNKPSRMDEIPDWIIKYHKAGYGSSAGKAIAELITIITKLRGLVNDAFLAGRSETSWDQFRKDNNF